MLTKKQKMDLETVWIFLVISCDWDSGGRRIKAGLALPLSIGGTFFTFNSLQKPPCDSWVGQ